VLRASASVLKKIQYFLTQIIWKFFRAILPIYVNPRNDKIQAKYNHKMEIRSRKDFLKLLKKNSKGIILK